MTQSTFGNLHIVDGLPVLMRHGQAVALTRGGRSLPVDELAEICALVRLRDAAQDLLDAQAGGQGEHVLGPLRKQLRLLHGRYVTRYGPVDRTGRVAQLVAGCDAPSAPAFGSLTDAVNAAQSADPVSAPPAPDVDKDREWAELIERIRAS